MISVATAMLCKEQGITITGICAVYELIVAQKVNILFLYKMNKERSTLNFLQLMFFPVFSILGTTEYILFTGNMPKLKITPTYLRGMETYVSLIFP